MKKILVGSGIIMMSTGLFAQEAADKKVQAGIVLGSGLAMQKMGTKLMGTNGVGNDLTIGANLNFNFSETISFCTGAEFDFNTVKYKPLTASPTYYNYNDTEIIRNEDNGVNNSIFQMTERKQNAVYLTVPTMLLFRTNFIGYMRYFGKFGLRNSFLLSSSISDKGFDYASGSLLENGVLDENESMKAPGDMFFFKSAVGLSAGAEWNFSGSTCLMAEFGFYYGITPLHNTKKEGKMTLYTSGTNNGTGNDVYYANKATQSQLQLKVSILF
jgi:hypothetical protein